MQTAVEIIWHGLEPMPHVEKRVRERVARIEKFFGRIIGCHVVVDAVRRIRAQEFVDEPR